MKQFIALGNGGLDKSRAIMKSVDDSYILEGIFNKRC